MSNPSPGNPQPLSPEEFERNLLEKEYFFLQTTIEDYNKQIWVIKALGITGTGAVLALMIQQKSNAIALIGCVIPLFFWILESQWKHFQHGFYPPTKSSKMFTSSPIYSYVVAAVVALLFYRWRFNKVSTSLLCF